HSQIIVDFLFFFSSRRRHTRWPRDWSSDVCSSDLAEPRVRAVAAHVRRDHDRSSGHRLQAGQVEALLRSGAAKEHVAPVQQLARSEERRVGKSVDLGGSRSMEKKKM